MTPSSLAKEEGGYNSESMRNVTAICVPKFSEGGKSYFSIIIRDLRHELPSGIYKVKYYNSLKEVFSSLKKIQTPIQDMGFRENNFFFGEKVKEYIAETEGIKLMPFTPSEKIEIERFIKELLSPKKDSSADETDKSDKK